MEPQPATNVQPNRKPKPRGTIVLLVLPYLGLCFPQLYSRATPALLGFPFFYWYQFAWVALTSGLLWIYYLRSKRSS